MLKIENVVLPSPEQWQAVIRGMRNPKNSWNRSDSEVTNHVLEAWPHETVKTFDKLGPNDHNLMMKLAKGGPVHAKYRRMINVWFDVTAPMFWWKEFDTYKVGTVRNSCSTMHKIHVKPFDIEDFSHEGCDEVPFARMALEELIRTLETLRTLFNDTQEKKYWRALIELLPSNYNMKATICTNYEVLGHMLFDREGHKIVEWHTFCDWVRSLPYSEIMTQKVVGIE